MKRRMISTPVGDMLLGVMDGKLCEVRRFEPCEESPTDDDPVLDEAKRQIMAYLHGARRTFNLPIAMCGSAFDCAVWRMLQEIPFGGVQTYGQLAAALGKPGAARAVGGACSRNPLLLVVPCHRVIAGTGKLTGFAAGLQMKRLLLSLEGQEVLGDRVILRR